VRAPIPLLETALPPLNKPTRIPNAISFHYSKVLGAAKPSGKKKKNPNIKSKTSN
jgi:hypothetical protein